MKLYLILSLVTLSSISFGMEAEWPKELQSNYSHWDERASDEYQEKKARLIDELKKRGWHFSFVPPQVDPFDAAADIALRHDDDLFRDYGEDINHHGLFAFRNNSSPQPVLRMTFFSVPLKDIPDIDAETLFSRYQELCKYKETAVPNNDSAVDCVRSLICSEVSKYDRETPITDLPGEQTTPFVKRVIDELFRYKQEGKEAEFIMLWREALQVVEGKGWKTYKPIPLHTLTCTERGKTREAIKQLDAITKELGMSHLVD